MEVCDRDGRGEFEGRLYGPDLEREELLRCGFLNVRPGRRFAMGTVVGLEDAGCGASRVAGASFESMGESPARRESQGISKV